MRINNRQELIKCREEILGLLKNLIYDFLFYQGVRDLLKVILEKILTIPNTVSSAVVQQLLAAREVI